MPQCGMAQYKDGTEVAKENAVLYCTPPHQISQGETIRDGTGQAGPDTAKLAIYEG